MGLKQINNFIPNLYYIKTVLVINDTSNIKHEALNLIIHKNLFLKEEKILKIVFLKNRKNKFIGILESEVLRQHQDYITWDNNWVNFNTVRTRKKLHTEFKINSDFKMDKIQIESKVSRKINDCKEKSKRIFKKKSNIIKNIVFFLAHFMFFIYYIIF